MSRLIWLRRRLLVALGFSSVVAIVACGSNDVVVAPPAAAPVAVAQVAAPDPEAVPEVEVVDQGDPGPIPVTSSDPYRGRRDALVTLVEFADFQCPFCARLEPTLTRLLETYGPAKLRIVWKQNPLPFHSKARPLAATSVLLYERRGPDGFWRAHDAFLSDQAHLDDLLTEASTLAGGTPEELQGTPDWLRADAKVTSDMTLGKSLGVNGIPASYVNGVSITGAQPYEKFAAVIDEQIEKAKEAMARGTPRQRVSVELTKAQYRLAPVEKPSDPKPEDNRPRRIPIGSSPVRGKAGARVTIVEFSDFQCPFCGRVGATLKQVETEYGDKVRFVYKHNPLPFHPRAEPAAAFAIEARAQRGERGFWAAYDLLFAKECVGSPASTNRQACMDAGGTWVDHQTRLDDADLAAYAKKLGLDVGRVQAAIASKKHAPIIAEDQMLAEDSGASGTPTFFINGRRLVGAQPIESFRKAIDEEIARANELLGQGVPGPKLYERLQVTALAAAFDLEKKNVPAPSAASPSRGPANAKVVIQMFGDFQCPFTKRVVGTIEELEKAYPGKIRLVWRNLPLPFHSDAPLAAEAAMEAFRQKGSAGFWAMHALLFANQPALDRQTLDGHTLQLGLDPVRMAQALDTRSHKPEVDADMRIAEDAHISGTPAFVINGYFVSGAQGLGKFRRVVDHALREASGQRY